VSLAVCMVLGAAAGARAQGVEAQNELTTSLGLTTNVPEADSFVQRSRRAPETLDFATPYAKDVVRPRPRSKAEVEALQRDLEAAGARNRARAGTATPPHSASPASLAPPR